MATAAELSRANVTDCGESTCLAVRALASLGANGQQPQNQERDLHRWVKGLYNLELSTYDVVMRLQVFGINSVQSFLVSNSIEFNGSQKGPMHSSDPKAPNDVGTSETAIPFLLPHEICHAVAMAGSRQVARNLKLSKLFQCFLPKANFTSF